MAAFASIAALCGCTDASSHDAFATPDELARVSDEVERGVLAFHAADTAKNAEAVIGLLWPDFEMFVDGERQSYAEIAAGSRAFMASLEFFHTRWSDLRIVPLGLDAAIASFQFRDSIGTKSGELIRSRGPTTFIWERRDGQWRIRYADADHYPIGR